jgi:hypothetical protein
MSEKDGRIQDLGSRGLEGFERWEHRGGLIQQFENTSPGTRPLGNEIASSKDWLEDHVVPASRL